MNSKITEIKDDELICFHNGYAAFSYGCPVDPILFNKTDFDRLNYYLINVYKYSILEEMPNTEMKHMHLNKEVGKLIGKKIVSINVKSELVYSSEESEIECNKIKEKIMQKVNSMQSSL